MVFRGRRSCIRCIFVSFYYWQQLGVPKGIKAFIRVVFLSIHYWSNIRLLKSRGYPLYELSEVVEDNFLDEFFAFNMSCLSEWIDTFPDQIEDPSQFGMNEHGKLVINSRTSEYMSRSESFRKVKFFTSPDEYLENS